MVSIKAFAIMAMATAASAATVSFTTFQNGDCTGSVTTSFSGPNGGGNTCHQFGGKSYGALYQVLSGATCVFKSWENSDCSGLATTRTIAGNTSGGGGGGSGGSGTAPPSCQAIANDNSGNFHVVNGCRSVSITCS
ncbi:hypothetical protein TWF694_005693 [Orbilia ellipsospora]|uniref:Secreted protein n=1 Tax=Orbilia ellipsospora TaxID=2528407 RepID=A0AAV9WRQ4_9PEZI